MKAPFRLLVAVGKVERGGFAATADGIANDPDAIAALRGEVAEVTNDITALGPCEPAEPAEDLILLDRLDWTRFPLSVIERLKYLETLGEEEVFVADVAA